MAQQDTYRLSNSPQALAAATGSTNETDHERPDSEVGLSGSITEISSRKRAIVLAGCSILQLPIWGKQLELFF